MVLYNVCPAPTGTLNRNSMRMRVGHVCAKTREEQCVDPRDTPTEVFYEYLYFVSEMACASHVTVIYLIIGK